MELAVNEIHDYLQRAPARSTVDQLTGKVRWHTHARLTWLADLARGTIDERINRRAGIVPDPFKPFHCTTQSAVRRHARRRRLAL